MRIQTIFILFAVILLALGAGCSVKNIATDSIGEESMAGSARNYKMAPSAVPMMDGDYAESSAYSSGQGITVEQKITKSGQINIEVDDYQAAAIKVDSITKKMGGHISDTNSNRNDNDVERGTITIRVPENNFDAAMAEFSELGKVTSKSANSDDVTEQYIDLTARINNSKAHEARLLSMYDKATTVNEMLQLENQISRVRGDIESMEGRLRYLNNKVELSTITVYLSEKAPTVSEWGIWQSIKNALNHSIATIRWLIEFIGIILPLAAFGAVIWLLIRWRLHKRKHKA